MTTHLYLSMIPEALVVSMLEPEEFGTYFSVGRAHRCRGQAMFFELKLDFRSGDLDIPAAIQRCVPHPDGRPRSSVYVCIYRAMERVPQEALQSLWLVARDGQVLRLDRGRCPSKFPGTCRLYQELCPVDVIVASRLNPVEFGRSMSDPRRPVSVPRICFADLELGALTEDPLHGDARNLPYRFIDHLRDCLAETQAGKDKPTKTFERHPQMDFPYRSVKTGFYVADSGGTICYPFPSAAEMERDHPEWWRSVNL